MGTENARQQGNGVVGSTLIEESQSTSFAEDVAFALRVRQGDHSAFQALYERYGGAVLGLAQSVVRDRAVAEDITHDVFLGFWRNPNAFEPSRGQFVAWLLRVTRNRAIDVLRKRREVPFGNARASQDGEAVDPTQWLADPESDLNRRRSYARLQTVCEAP